MVRISDRFKISLWAILLLAFCSCLPKHEVVRQPERPHSGNQRPQPDTPRTPSGTSASGSSSRPGTSAAGLQYIDRFRQIAIEEMNLHGIPASIKLAQGILESGNGNSLLARESNNHFGIKCTSDWTGGRSYHDDDAQDDCFRVYSRPEESFRDHSQFLLRRRYQNLFTLDRTDYKGWARGLKAAGYATNPRYADLLIDLIERYELYQLDQPGGNSPGYTVAQRQPTGDGRRVPEKTTTTNTTASTNDAAPVNKPPVTMKIHEVRAGETLTEISSRYGLTPQEILLMNGLRSQDVHPGQLLVVSKM